jgi:hypothetical protein
MRAYSKGMNRYGCYYRSQSVTVMAIHRMMYRIDSEILLDAIIYLSRRVSWQRLLFYYFIIYLLAFSFVVWWLHRKIPSLTTLKNNIIKTNCQSQQETKKRNATCHKNKTKRLSFQVFLVLAK